MGPLDKYILKEDALKATQIGFELSFQSHWYRSLPLSCMDFNLKINGENVDNQHINFLANGHRYSYKELPDLDNEWLFILDKATIEVPHQLKTGEQYDIEFNLDLYIPYILVDPESKPLMAGSRVKKNLICR